VRYMEKEIEELKEEIEELRKEIEKLKGDLDELYENEIKHSIIARAVCELQDEMRKHHDVFFVNEIDAPTQVGMK